MLKLSRMPRAISAPMPWPFGTDLVQRHVAVVDRDRLDPVRLVVGKIGFLDQAAGLAGMRDDRRGKLAVIEIVTVAFGDARQRARLSGTNELFRRQRRAAVRREGLAIARLRQQLAHLLLPLPMHRRRHQIAVGGVPDRRLEQVRERQLAELVRQRAPGGDDARHRHRVPAAARHGVFSLEVTGRHPLRRPPRGVQSVQLAVRPDQRKTVAADPVHARLDHRQRNRRGKSGVDRVAAAQIHRKARGRRQRLRGADDIGSEQRHALRDVGERPE